MIEAIFQTGNFSLASGWFLIAFAIFLTGYMFVYRRIRLRNAYILAFSLFFYWKLSGAYVLLLCAIALNDWLEAKFLDRLEPKSLRAKLIVAWSLCVNLAILLVFKAAGFFFDLVEMLSGRQLLSLAGLAIPAGISFFIFQSISYIVDVYRGNLKPLRSYFDYLLLLSFFPKMFLGPLVGNGDFIGQIHSRDLNFSREDTAKSSRYIVSGIIKYCVISRVTGALITIPAFQAAGESGGAVSLLGMYAFAIQIYCDFSGFTDLATGIAGLMGFRLSLNFDAPYKSATVTEFWRRWHISLSTWLKNYLYIPLGGSRKGRYRTYANLIITMLLGGLWHGVGDVFIIWGLIIGVALALHKVYLEIVPGSCPTGKGMSALGRIAGVALTFHVILLGWLFFNSPSSAHAVSMLKSVFCNFNVSAAGVMISESMPAFVIMCIGYILHFLPASWNNWSDRILAKGGVPLSVVMIAAAIWVTLQLTAWLIGSDAAGLPIYATF